MKKTKRGLLIAALVACLLAVGCGDESTPTIDGGITGSDTESESTHTHNFGEWKAVTAPTCTETGTQERRCACGETERETLAALGHSYVNRVCEHCGQKEPIEGLNFTSIDDGNSWSVAGIGTCADTDIVIPSVYEGKPVTGIRDSAFKGCSHLTSIVIPDSVTSIGYRAFYECTGLASITIPDSVTSIGWSAFYNTAYYNDESNWVDDMLYIGSALIDCKEDKVGAVTIKDGTTCIAESAFQYTDLTSVIIPSSVIGIGETAFSSCSGLTSITVAEDNTAYHAAGNCLIETAGKILLAGCKNSVIPADGSVTSISESAFQGRTGLTSITIPDGVTTIGEYAFAGCTDLTDIAIPDSVTSIGDYAFFDCFGLTSITIPNSVTSIGVSVFEDCWSLTSIIIPNSVTSIGQHAFDDCSGLTDIIISNSVTSIGTGAFSGCRGLTNITIPDSVTSIGSQVFGESALKDITFTGTQAQWEAITKDRNWRQYARSFTVHCTDGDISYDSE